ncbi:MAG TPA: enhanced serine sensitivity protein SseB C-terminal domain-containing protein [Candidatus Binatia bacterium]|nr:enhanced serine sensitivity protein SseB C-terminal domain-containing protein [Candidatus Binatia bacterium]
MTQPAMTFVCEQDGPPEQALKGLLARAFDARDRVARAFLARVDYGDGAYAVALCVRTVAGTEEMGVVRDVAEAFRQLFGRDQHLDVCFLDDEQEARVRRVCRPFYERRPGPRGGLLH